MLCFGKYSHKTIIQCREQGLWWVGKVQPQCSPNIGSATTSHLVLWFIVSSTIKLPSHTYRTCCCGGKTVRWVWEDFVTLKGDSTVTTRYVEWQWESMVSWELSYTGLLKVSLHMEFIQLSRAVHLGQFTTPEMWRAEQKENREALATHGLVPTPVETPSVPKDWKVVSLCRSGPHPSLCWSSTPVSQNMVLLWV